MRLSSFLCLIISLLVWATAASDASAYTKKTLKVIMFGDAVVGGYGLFDPKDALPLQLESATRDSNVKFTMSAMGAQGDTTSTALSRVRALIAAKPDIVVLALGGNDALHGVDPDVMYNNLEIVLNELQRAGVYILFCGMKAPPSLGYDYAVRYDRVFPKLAERKGVAFYPFLLDGVTGNRLYLQRDGIQPSKEGVKVIADKMAPYLRQMVLKLKYSRSDWDGPAKRPMRHIHEEEEAAKAAKAAGEHQKMMDMQGQGASGLPAGGQ